MNDLTQPYFESTTPIENTLKLISTIYQDDLPSKLLPNRKSQELIYQLVQRPYSNIAWCPHSNLIAFSRHNGVIDFANSENAYAPVFVLHPDTPHLYSTIITTHTTPITALAWSSASFATYLLTADDKFLCLWKQQNDFHTWKCVHKFSSDLIVAVKWLFRAPPKIETVVPDFTCLDDKFVSTEERQDIDAPPGTMIFITVSRIGRVTVYYSKPFSDEGWGTLTENLRYIPQRIVASAEFSTTETGTVLLTTRPTVGNVVHTYEIRVNLSTESMSMTLVTSLSLPLGLQNERISTQAIPQSHVIHLRADPTTGKTMYTITLASGECKLTKWELRVIPIEFFVPVDDQEFPLQTTWNEIGSILLDTEGRCLPTAFDISQDGSTLLIAYSDGRIEMREVLELRIVNTTQLPQVLQENGTKKRKSVEDQDEVPPSVPVALCFSPSNHCLCVLHDSPTKLSLLCRLDMENGADPFFARTVVDLLELCVLRNVDYWDILVSFVYQLHHLTPDARLDVSASMVACIEEDYSRMEVTSQELYRIDRERLKRSVFRSLGFHINEIDCQVKLYLYYIRDVFHAALESPSMAEIFATAAINHTSAKTFVETQAFVFASSQTSKVPSCVDWLSCFGLFFLKNIQHLCKLSREQLLVDLKDPRDIHTIAYLSLLLSLPEMCIPTISFLIDSETLNLIHELLLFCVAYQLHSKDMPKYVEMCHTSDLILAIKQTCFNCWQQEPVTGRILKQLFENMAVSIEPILQTFKFKSEQHARTLLDKLNLLPLHCGFLVQNQVSIDQTKQINAFTYQDNLETKTLVTDALFQPISLMNY